MFAELNEFKQQIENDRVRLGIQPVLLHRMPAWAKQRLGIAVGHQSLTNAERKIPGPRIFDHWGMTLSGSLVGEPYARATDPLIESKVRKIAQALGVSYSIGNPWSSWWFPGRTLRIEFFETPESKQLDQLRADAKRIRRTVKTLFDI